MLGGVVDRGRSECDGGGSGNGGGCIVGDRTRGHVGERTAGGHATTCAGEGPGDPSIQVVIHDCSGEILRSGASRHAGACRRDGYGSWCWWRLRRRFITAAADKAEKARKQDQSR